MSESSSLYLGECALADLSSLISSGRVHRGQIPHWLDWSLISRPWDSSSPSPPSTSSSKPISWSFHSEIYLGSPEWKAASLPTFNSFAIESQLHNTPLLSSNFVSMNDDFFIVRAMTASDFHSELLGPVFKVQDDLKVTGKKNARVGDGGEWAALDWAAWTLGELLRYLFWARLKLFADDKRVWKQVNDIPRSTKDSNTSLISQRPSPFLTSTRSQSPSRTLYSLLRLGDSENRKLLVLMFVPLSSLFRRARFARPFF